MASGMQWNALSQAAKKGYSNKSGIDRMSSQCMCFHCELRTPRRLGGGGGIEGSPLSQWSQTKWQCCLVHSMPEKACRWMLCRSSVMGIGLMR